MIDLGNQWKASAVYQIANIGRERFQKHMRDGVILGTGIEGGGSSGSHRLFGFRNIMEIAVARVFLDNGAPAAQSFQAAAQFAYRTTRVRGQVLREAGFPFPITKQQTLVALYDGKAEVTTDEYLSINPAILGRSEAVTIVNATRVFCDVVRRLGDDPHDVLSQVYTDGPRAVEEVKD